ncbi:unnamed protein product [Phytophthora lilii]|uniref:Unnamed protein product n=1 Tax=Phytophthora lilii TaxID=2077276 RepID=A0A9W6TL98_9STRA|nr:unnamed protein product [Phytophthora lilii]
MWLWCLGVIATTLSLDAVDGYSYRTSLAVFDDESCSSPASVVKFTQGWSCGWVEDHYNLPCQSNGVTSFVSDCDVYSIGGYDNYGLPAQVFGDSAPYLVVEEYNIPGMGECGVWSWSYDYGLGDVTAYRLDEDCHSSVDGMSSTKLSLGDTLRITKYSDRYCNYIWWEKEVTWAMATQHQCVENTKYYLRGGKPSMAAVALFDDMSCSETPTKISFTQNFGCSARQDAAMSVCGPNGPTQYSISSCTADYSALTSSVFHNDNNPYVMVERFSNWLCGAVQSVTVYAADGLCHANPDEGISFRATLNPDGSATITSFIDLYCGQSAVNTEVTKSMLTHFSCVSEGCDSPDGCSVRYSVGGLGGPPARGSLTAVAVYDSSSCSPPAIRMELSRSLVCKPQEKSWDPICANDGGVYTISDCTDYSAGGWDSHGLLNQSFGPSESYLVVEEYDTSLGSCGDTNAITGVTAYRLDGNCHTSLDGLTSTKLMLDRTLTIAKYLDPQCTIVASGMDVTWEMAFSSLCFGDNKKSFFSGALPDLTAVILYDDSTCSEHPVKLTFTQLFGCNGPLDSSQASCVSDGPARFSASSCTRDYTGLTTKTFGDDTPYLMVEEFSDYWCGQLQKAEVFVADDLCHTSTDGTSFRASITKEGSATITTFLDPSCDTVDNTIAMSKRKLIESYTCSASTECGVNGALCSKRISYGGLGGPMSNGKMTSVRVYGESSCSQPSTMVTFTRDLVCTPQTSPWSPVCAQDGDEYVVSDCTNYRSGGWDDHDTLIHAFSFFSPISPYLLVEKYDTSLGTCGDDIALDSATAYLLDETICHTNRDGSTSTNLMLGHTLIVTNYEDPHCTFVASQTEVSWSMAYWGSCEKGDTEATRYSFRGNTPEMTVVSVFADESCSKNPVKVTFTQDFVCEAQQHPEKAVCTAEGSELYAISSCSGYYLGTVDTSYGFDIPYVMVEHFSDDWCGQVLDVIVYTADGSCHSNTDELTSFRVTITPEGSTTITTYNDSICTVVSDNTVLSKRELTSYRCNQDTTCSNDDGRGCSTRITAGGLGGPRSRGQMTAVTMYANNKCSQPAFTMELSKEIVCTPQADSSRPVCDEAEDLSFSSDCTFYYRGGDNDFGLIDQAFSGFGPYLVIEEYNEWCGRYENVENVTIYHLDEECHVAHDGTASTKLTLGLSLTVTEFADTSCTVMTSETEIQLVDAVYSGCYTQPTTISRLRSGLPDLTAVVVYDNDFCSGIPVEITFTQYFKCQAEISPTCKQDSDNQYSISSCTRDYFGLTKSAFGDEIPHVVVEDFLDQRCELLQRSTVYIADGTCHSSIDGTSFQATLGSDSSVTITLFSDAACKNVTTSNYVRSEIFSYSCIQNDGCTNAGRYGCGRKISIGGLGGSPSFGRMTGIVTYDDNSCSQPATSVTFTRELTCNSQKDNETACVSSGNVYSSSHCVNSTDTSTTYRFLDEAFGWRTHLFMQRYDSSLGYCGEQKALAAANAYLLDENCHASSSYSASVKLTFGKSLTISNYDGPDCSDLISETMVTWDMATYGSCDSENTRYYLRGPTADFTAVAVFDDRTCYSTPVKLTLTKLFGCNVDQDAQKASCRRDGSTLYSVSSCVGDYLEFVDTTFGNHTPYVIERKFSDGWCGILESVTVYVADGTCHSNTDDATSFKVTLKVDGQTTIVNYDDPNCRSESTNSIANVGYDGYDTTCQTNIYCGNPDGSACSKQFSVGGVRDSGPTSAAVVTVYDDSSCAGAPVQLVATNQLVCSTPGESWCNGSSNGEKTVYQEQSCVDDVATFTISTFDSTPYLAVERYISGTNCRTQESAIVYNADGKCHYNIADGTHFRILPSVGGSVTIATYPNSLCEDSEADYITVGTKYIGTDACYEGNLRFYADMNPKQVLIDYKAREEIMFPEWLWEPTPRRVFVSS